MSPRKKPPPPHPLAKAIDDVLGAGHTPRIHVDARRNDVTVPGHVRERWQARLVIDLDPGWPLNLEHEKDGLAVDLAFQGLVSRCKFGWGAIYVVLDRATGRGTVVEAHLPPHELPPELSVLPDPRGAGANGRKTSSPPMLVAVAPPAVSRVPPEDVPSPEGLAPSEERAEKPRRATKKNGSPPSRRSATARAEIPPPPVTDDTASETTSSEDRARERRARFRVIDGGR